MGNVRGERIKRRRGGRGMETKKENTKEEKGIGHNERMSKRKCLRTRSHFDSPKYMRAHG